jgi:hypothetical protein
MKLILKASAGERDAFVGQWQALLESLASVPGPRWISPPAAIRAAEDKAVQLATAARIGFNAPPTKPRHRFHQLGEHDT